MSKIMVLIQKSVKRFMMKAIKTDGILVLIEIGRSVTKMAEFHKVLLLVGFLYLLVFLLDLFSPVICRLLEG